MNPNPPELPIKSLTKMLGEALGQMLKTSSASIYNDCAHILEAYLDQLPEEDVLNFQLDEDEISQFLLSIVVNHFTSEKMRSELKNEVDIVIKKSQVDLKEYKKINLPKRTKIAEEAAEKEIDDAEMAELMKSLTATQRALIKKIYEK